MSAGEGLDIGYIARTTLDGVVAHFAASEVELPERRVIVPGEPRSAAWENCEALTVGCAGVLWGQGPGTGSGTARRTGTPVLVGERHVVIVVQLIRCVPVSFDEADPDELTEAGLTVMRDMGLLSQALVELCGRAGALKSMGAALAGGVEMVGPEGCLVASEGSLTVTAGKLI